jgi:hypothetical protein
MPFAWTWPTSSVGSTQRIQEKLPKGNACRPSLELVLVSQQGWLECCLENSQGGVELKSSVNQYFDESVFGRRQGLMHVMITPFLY